MSAASLMELSAWEQTPSNRFPKRKHSVIHCTRPGAKKRAFLQYKPEDGADHEQPRSTGVLQERSSVDWVQMCLTMIGKQQLRRRALQGQQIPLTRVG